MLPQICTVSAFVLGISNCSCEISYVLRYTVVYVNNIY